AGACAARTPRRAVSRPTRKRPPARGLSSADGEDHGRRDGARGTGRQHIAAGAARPRYPNSALLLSPEALDRWKLPDVHGEGGGDAEAHHLLQYAGARRHDRRYTRPGGGEGPPRGARAAAAEPSARLPDLRSGRGVLPP